MKNWAIVIGINNYSNLQSLNCAKQDAELMADWLKQSAGFDQVFLFTENSPPILTNPPISTQPTYGHVRGFLRRQFENKLLTSDDNLWFFFSGHGIREQGKDYLMLADSDPGDIEYTTISVEFIIERLRRSGSGHIVLFFDACRNLNQKDGRGFGNETYPGVVTFYSCRANQRAYEIKELEHSAFTFALLEGLKKQSLNNYIRVQTLYEYLCRRVPELAAKQKQEQNPCLLTDVSQERHLLLRLNSASSIQDLKFQAYLAENEGNWELAKKIWCEIYKASRDDDDAAKALAEILLKEGSFKQPEIPESKIEPEVKPLKTEQPKEVQLVSAKGVDYTKLRDLLKAGNWREADEETANRMLEAAGRTEEGWLRVEDIDNFPCEDLRTIDQLWVNYSNGRFGFSVQKRIYQSLGGTREYNEEVWEAFGDRVGWRKEGDWLYYNDLSFDISAQSGHLPGDVGWFFGRVIGLLWVVGDWLGVCGLGSSLASRLVKCNI